MLLHVPDILTPDQVAHGRRLLEEAQWVDGRVTAGSQSSRAKRNLQLPESSPAARGLGDDPRRAPAQPAVHVGRAAVEGLSAAVQSLRRGDTHSAATSTTPSARCRARLTACAPISRRPCSSPRPRTTTAASWSSRIPTARTGQAPGRHMVLYPSTSLHHVTPVTRGERLAAFFWIQSLVRDDGQRTLLFDMDTAIQQLARDAPDHPSTVQLTGVYHNLLRQWAEL